jgi:tetratricopeptide (TPR) repeat protein
MRLRQWLRNASGRLSLLIVLALPFASDFPPTKLPLLRRIQSELLTDRFTAGRLIGQTWRSCAAPDTALLIARTRCADRLGLDDALKLAALGRMIDAETQAPRSSRLHATALVQLRTGDSALTAAVSSLELARQSAPDDARVLNDLAVAYLEVATRDQQFLPLLEALDAVEQALRINPRLIEARFNRALLLERVSLVSSAGRAWREYVGVEPDFWWTREAKRHLRQLDPISSGAAGLGDPQQARDDFFRLLAHWGRSIQARDAQRADSLARSAAAVGDSLRRSGADATIDVSARWLASRKPGPETESIAAALIDFALGLEMIDNAQQQRAAAVLDTARRVLGPAGFPGIRWIEYAQAYADANRGDLDRADVRLDSIRAEAGATEPAVRGKALWLRGVTQVRRGNYEIANTFYDSAASLFAHARDRRNAAAIAWLQAEALSLAGQTSSSLDAALRGVRSLTPFRQSVYLTNHLLLLAGLARAEGLNYAALDLMTESVAVIGTPGRGDARPLALSKQARDLASIGEIAEARRTLQSALREATALGSPSGDFAVGTINLERGRLWRVDAVDSAAAQLALAEATFARLSRRSLLAPVQYEQAMLARSRGDTSTQRAKLRQALATLEGQGDRFGTAESRAAFYETTENVFDAMIDLELSANRPESAFEYLERGRTAMLRSSGSTQVATEHSLRAIAGALPAGVSFVSYAVLRERTVVWWASRKNLGSRTIAISRDSLRALVRNVSDNHYDPKASGDAWTRLSFLLLGTLDSALTGATQLAIAPDRELGSVSFAALRSPATGHFLLEDFSLRTVPSGDFVLGAARRRRAPAAIRSALVVGDPQTANALALPPLRGAGIEADSIAHVYARSVLLKRADAQRVRVTASMPAYSVFHFAGHAVLNQDRPERSYLAFAADSAFPSGKLEAREIGALDLSKVELVVLSACTTMMSRSTRSGPVAGLAYTFLRAGAPRTISTLWDIRDEPVVDLLVDLHARIARGVEPMDALHAAQRAALHSTRAELRSPAVWAAFIYTGP